MVINFSLLLQSGEISTARIQTKGKYGAKASRRLDARLSGNLRLNILPLLRYHAALVVSRPTITKYTTFILVKRRRCRSVPATVKTICGNTLSSCTPPSLNRRWSLGRQPPMRPSPLAASAHLSSPHGYNEQTISLPTSATALTCPTGPASHTVERLP